MESICVFFNSPTGCKFSADECKRPHVKIDPCTNEICIKNKINYGHTNVTCRNTCVEPFIKRKTRVKDDICTDIYVQVKDLLDSTKTELPLLVTPGKIVGMLFEGLSLKELTQVMINEKQLLEYVTDAIDILEAEVLLSDRK
jgi:hypothetical protein